MKYLLGATIGATLALFVRAFVTTTAVVMAVYLVVDPNMLGAWKAQVEQGYFNKADRIGLWSE